jgi:hypothetical protein
MSYVPLGRGRFSIVPGADSEVLVIPAVRNIILLAFLSVWLAGWTVGGIAAMMELANAFHPFLLFWLIGWAIGWIFAATTLAWMLGGSQMLTFLGQDLEITLRIFGFSRRKLFRGRDIRDLDVVQGPQWPGRQMPQMPFGPLGDSGAVRFTYGTRSQHLAAGMDQAEATEIVAWLKKRLPGV